VVDGALFLLLGLLMTVIAPARSTPTAAGREAAPDGHVFVIASLAMIGLPMLSGLWASS